MVTQNEEVIDTEYTVPTVALVPVPEQDPVVQGFKEQGVRMLAFAQKASVIDLATAKDATNDIATARNLVKALEEKRKLYKAPILEAGKTVDRFFETLEAPLKEADKTYSDKLVKYHQEEERKRQEAIRLEQLRQEQHRLELEAAARKAREEREAQERKAKEEREKAEREQRLKEEEAARLNAPPPPPLPEPEPLPPPPQVILPEPPKPVDIPDPQKHVRAEAGMVGFTWVLDKERVEAALAKGVREIPGIAIWLEPKYKVLKLDQVPLEYKRQSTRVTR